MLTILSYKTFWQNDHKKYSTLSISEIVKILSGYKARLSKSKDFDGIVPSIFHFLNQ